MYKVLIFVLGLLVLNSCKNRTEGFQRTESSFNSDWAFTKDSTSLKWETVQIPHTPEIEPLVVNDQWQGDAWYKKTFERHPESKKSFLEFEGVMHEAWVWVNGHLLKHHQGGYLPFTVDMTDVLKIQNTLIVKVNNENNPHIPPGKPLEQLDFNYYGGIYRNVNLVETHSVYITDPVAANQVNSGGVLVHFDSVSKEKAMGLVKVHFRNESSEDKKISAKIVFKSPSGRTISKTTESAEVTSSTDRVLTTQIDIENPELWGIHSPKLYQVNVNLMEGETILDTKELTTGIRAIELNANGFFLNGENVFIQGTNRHQEYPYVGYAISDEANYRDAVKIKNAGFDFVRLSHYPQTEAFLDACDELGLLVMNCISGWQFFGGEEFQENAYQEIKDFARRDRHHPSIVFWENSLNESPMTEEFMMKANALLKAELPYEDTYSAGWIDHPSYDLYIPARQHAKAPTYWTDYEKNARKIFIAEYGDWEYYAQNAGFNQTAFENLSEDERTSRQGRGDGERRLLQQAFNFQEAFNSNLKGEHTIGHANWLMFDYNRGYADNIEHSGIRDIFRIPKFAYYFYKSQRSPAITYEAPLEAGPVVYIANYWTPTSPQAVRVFSNTDEVALYLNEKLIARQTPTRNAFSSALPHPPFEFKLSEFKAGTLKAVGYIDGEEVAIHEVKTPSEAQQIRLKVDTSGIGLSQKQDDIVFLHAEITDAEGTLVPGFEGEIKFSIESESAELIGQNPIKAEAGIASILLKTKTGSDVIMVVAKAEGLESEPLILRKKQK
ncbi:glycoside hydrolase family 2 protein [Psychroflexus sp. YR1-1]|uniref:Glycoside hydrolase family 2 protein n=1 Tax=Psychroflexus aurantiacus TaxID=2709310 RepID=A0A6B3R0T2_9FLAO|nr:glycoside hydrolase family 2 TIM barrel-domain containing protein [Psychroflexus aurantiacus]NEV93822.1 glycoside hydrolase family 2 protein [Psychroflexus aurantiacus]